jgi:hypothetical protein
MTGISKVPKRALGVRSHSGWAAYVVLEGSAKAPDIVARGRMVLCDGHKQPFHEAETMPFARAEKFIAACRTTAAKLADDAIKGIGHVAGCCVLSASGKPLPGLVGILASHALIHSAEGAFYRDAVAEACARAKIAVSRVRERDIQMDAEHLGAWRERLAEFGKQFGAPWTQDEKLAALGAWLVLAARRSKR